MNKEEFESFDFDRLIDRRGTDSLKWDSTPDADMIPLWVADMDFAAAPCIRHALQQRLNQGVLGYVNPGEDYFESVRRWQSVRHGWSFPREWMLYTSGVVPALSATIKALCRPGDGVIVLTPVYNCFYSSIRNNGCRVVSCPLLVGEDGKYHIDFNGLERLAADPRNRMLLLCNPHNPGGRVWREDELLQLGRIALAHGLTPVSDEVHAEFCFEGFTFRPWASLSSELAQRVITLTAPTKAFNTAGLQIATIVCADADARRAIDRAINDNETCDVNPFGLDMTRAAYTPEGARWLKALMAYIEGNYRMLCKEFSTYVPAARVMPLEATYLAWVDVRAVTAKSSAEVEEHLKQNHHVWISRGTLYGPEGEGYVRINMACPRARLEQGLARIVAGLESIRS